MKRLSANLIIAIALVTLPWWAAALLAVIFAVLFDFLEIVFYGVVLDILYAVPYNFFWGHIFLISAIVLYALSALIRPNLRSV